MAQLEPEPTKTPDLTIFLALLEDSSPSDHLFSVIADGNTPVSEWKKLVLAERQNRLKGYDAADLILWKLNKAIPSDQVDTDVAALAASQNPSEAAVKILPTKKLSHYFPSTPTDDSLHVIVELPSLPSVGQKHGLSDDDADGTPASKRKKSSKQMLPEPGTSSSDSEASPDNKKQKVQRKPRLSDPAKRLYPRPETVRGLYEILEKHRFIFVRGTPASGKSSLAYLLRTYINDNHPELQVYMLSRYRDHPAERPVPTYRQWLADNNWEFQEGGVLILDEAQLSYWDSELWDEGIKSIGSDAPYMVILFASYGSAGRNLLPKTTPFRVQDEQLVGLARGPSSPIGLLFTREETEGVVKKKFPNHRFDETLLEYVYDLTSGHVGAYCDALEVVQKSSLYREKTGDSKYTYYDWLFSMETAGFLHGLYTHGVFSRGLPTRGDLNRHEYAKSLLQVLNKPERFVLITEEEDHDPSNPLRQCLERGWLFSERHAEEQIKYRFASRLHELYTEWLLLGGEDLIKAPTLYAFVVEVVKCFSPQNLRTRENLGGSNNTPQSIPEAQFQQEFYRACHVYTGGWVTTFPECGTAKGRIDFFISSKKWGIELLRDGVKRSAHNARFTTGEYGEWVKNGTIDDYIMIDFRSRMPKSVGGVIKNSIYVVSTDSWETVKIYDTKLVEIDSFRLFYH